MFKWFALVVYLAGLGVLVLWVPEYMTNRRSTIPIRHV
jgi:hypothetical protein